MRLLSGWLLLLFGGVLGVAITHLCILAVVIALDLSVSIDAVIPYLCGAFLVGQVAGWTGYRRLARAPAPEDPLP